jgi:hypothetical protein
MTIDELKREALGLDPTDRASLARDLLESLANLTDAEIERLWFDEAERRHQQIVDGTVETVSMEEALSEARAARP